MSKYGVISGAYFPVFGTRDPNSYNKSFQNIDIMKFGKALVVLTGAQLEGGGGRSPLPFFKSWEKVPLIVEKIP